MSKRFTVTEKWEDAWFSELKPLEKLVFNYLCDKCNLAGFWEINVKTAAFQVGVPKPRFLGALQELGRAYITNGKYLWLRRFIEHQGNLPLNPKNNAHKHIIALLEKHTDFKDVNFFEELGAVQVLNSTPGISISNGIGNGISNVGRYTLQQVQDAACLVGLEDDKSRAFFDHYNAQGWVFGNGQPIVELPSALARWRNNGYKFEKKIKDKSAGELLKEYSDKPR